jgi:hypothetical protein
VTILDIERAKLSFIARYNPDRQQSVALAKALGAAAQHNLLYSKPHTTTEKRAAQEKWKVALTEIGKRFEGDITVDVYEKMVLELKDTMNQSFPSLFDNGSSDGSMFRVSHAQKSISVYIKHLWCCGEIAEPNICPVDRVILKRTAAKNRFDLLKWTGVNSIEEYRVRFDFIRQAAHAASMSVACWELSHFST